MCLVDWQLGRLIRTQIRKVIVATTTTVVAVPNNDRVAISFAKAYLAEDISVMPEQDATGDGEYGVNQRIMSGIGVDTLSVAFNHILHFTLKDHGELPTKRWSAIANTESELLVVEYILPEWALHLTPQQLSERTKLHA